MFIDFALYKVHAETAETGKWSNLSTERDNVEYNTKIMQANKVIFNPTEGKCL